MEALDVALERLDMLSTVTNARREFLSEMRLRGVRSQTSCDFSWRRKNDLSSEDSQDDWYSLPIKENLGMEKVMVFGNGSRRRVRRVCKARSLPYDINRRKALSNTLISPMCRVLGPSSSPTLPLILQEHLHSLPFSYDALNTKTRKTETFPVPLLSRTRSKSLEDLRESPNKSKAATRFQLLHCDDSSDGSCNGSNSSPLSLSPRNSFLNVLKGEASIKQEIDSMSMRIEKLDVT